MAVLLIALAGGICWIALLTFAWLLCRAAKWGDEHGVQDRALPVSHDPLPPVAQRR